MDTERSERAARLKGVDGLRFVAFVAVCFIHTARWRQAPDATPDWVDGLTLACRFCVPFFFLASGYFAAGAERKGAPTRLLGRIGLIFAVWALVYIAVTPGGLGRLADVKFDLLTLVDGGPGFHLWFLPALAVGALVASFLSSRPRGLMLGVIAAAGLLGWAAASFGPGRFGPYAGRYLSAVAYVCAGAFWRSKEGGVRLDGRGVCALILGGLALEAIEAIVLSGWRLRPIGKLEFPLGAAPLGFGLFLASLAWTPRAFIARLASALGRWTLGLYAVHLGIAMALFAVLPWATLAERLGVCGLTIAGSIAAVAVLRRTPLRRIVE